MRYAESVAWLRSTLHPENGKGPSGSGRKVMLQDRRFGQLAIALLATVAAGGALASENKIAVAPGGPHPYFAPWEQAAADAKKDFGIAAVDYKVPTDWKLELQQELLNSLATQGYKAFGIFPGDPVGINS